MSGEEVETCVRWSRSREDKLAHIWTNDPTVMRQMDRRVNAYPDVYKVERRAIDGVFYACPIDRIKFLAPPSEAKREASRKNWQNGLGIGAGSREISGAKSEDE